MSALRSVPAGKLCIFWMFLVYVQMFFSFGWNFIPQLFFFLSFLLLCVCSVGKSTFLKVLTGQLALTGGSMRLGETARVGYYEQGGLNLTSEQEASTVLRFVMEAVERGGQALQGQSGGIHDPSSHVVVEVAGAVGRRKALAGKEAGVSAQVSSSGGGSGASVGFSEQEAMKLLTRFQFPAKRWYDQVGRLSGGERRRLQLLQVLAKAPNVLLLDEPSNDLGKNDKPACVYF